MGELPSRRYSAFVSYRHHAVDQFHAIRLMRALERFTTPRELRKQGYPTKLDPVFRDDEEAGVHDTLSSQLQEALSNAKTLLVICTPRTRDSVWVEREVTFFKSLGDARPIIPILVEGDPADAIPDYLRANDQAAGWESDERLYVDLRDREGEKPGPRFRQGLLRIAAAALEVRYDDLAQRAATQARRQRLRRSASTSAMPAYAKLTIAAAI